MQDAITTTTSMESHSLLPAFHPKRRTQETLIGESNGRGRLLLRLLLLSLLHRGVESHPTATILDSRLCGFVLKVVTAMFFKLGRN